MPTTSREAPRPGQYRHFKGGLYEVLGVARHSETEEELVVYRPLYGEGGLWVRPLALFCEVVTLDGVETPRFTRVSESEPTAINSIPESAGPLR
jgi:hypothetical protein